MHNELVQLDLLKNVEDVDTVLLPWKDECNITCLNFRRRLSRHVCNLSSHLRTLSSDGLYVAPEASMVTWTPRITSGSPHSNLRSEIASAPRMQRTSLRLTHIWETGVNTDVLRSCLAKALMHWSSMPARHAE